MAHLIRPAATEPQSPLLVPADEIEGEALLRLAADRPGSGWILAPSTPWNSVAPRVLVSHRSERRLGWVKPGMCSSVVEMTVVHAPVHSRSTNWRIRRARERVPSVVNSRGLGCSAVWAAAPPRSSPSPVNGRRAVSAGAMTLTSRVTTGPSRLRTLPEPHCGAGHGAPSRAQPIRRMSGSDGQDIR